MWKIINKYKYKIAGVALGFQGLYSLQGGRGFWLAEMVRRGVAASGFSILNRSHNYGSTFRLGSITDSFDADIAYRSMAYAPICFSVPGAIFSGTSRFFGNRTDGGIATAFALGRVVTRNNDFRRQITNFTHETHLLHEGKVEISFYEKDGYVYVSYVGTGTGNLAYMNEVFGKLTFDFMIKLNFKDAIS